MKSLLPRFYFSFRSPYAWIAARQIEESFQLSPECLDYVPVWEPDPQTMALLTDLGGEFLYVPMSKHKRLYILQDVKRITAQLGYQMRWPVDKSPHWEVPHLTYLYACQQGKGKLFFKRIYELRWQHGEDICAKETIGHLAADIGLDPDRLLAAIDHPDIRKTGAKMLYKAYRDSVFGFPFFVSRDGRHKFWGTDRLKDFMAFSQLSINSS
ncbi:MAG: DsbA family protein [Cyanobacteria bacterium P01_H01_bin.105]